MKKSRVAVLLLAFVMLFSVFAGCKGQTEEVDFENLPDIDRTEKVKLTVWVPREAWAPSATYDLNDCYKEVEKILNIDLEFIHPTIGNEQESFGFMLLDKTLPDIIIPGTWYDGGPKYGIEHGLFVDIDPYVKKYAPDYYQLLQDRPDIQKEVVTDEGKIAAIYGIDKEEEYAYSGPIWNKHALDAIGEETAPLTLSDWERVLTALKEKGYTAPMSLHAGGIQYLEHLILSAFGVDYEFFIDTETQKVKFGSLEQGYYDYLNLMRKWMDAGLIDPQFETRDWTGMVDNFKKNKTAVVFDNPANALALYGEYGVDWVDGPYPVQNEGDRLNIRLKNWYASAYNNSNNSVAVVSKSCKHIDRALDFLNYGFTEEGAMLYNFGIEGKSYTMVDGKPTFTDIYFQEGTDIYEALYTYKVHNGVFERREKYANPTIEANPELKEIMIRWTENADATANFPPVSYTRDEQRILDMYLSDINILIGENIVAYISGKGNIIGSYPANANNNLTKQIKEMGIDDILAVAQRAYDRYVSR